MSSVALALCALGCSSPLEPEREAALTPELRFSELQDGRMRDGGILFVEMVAVDPSYQLHANEYLPLTVTSNAGEVESLRLRREICGLEAGQSYICQFFFVRVGDGHDVRNLEPALNGLNARLTLVTASLTLGSAYAFGDWYGTMATVRTFPSVVNVDYVRLLVSKPDPASFTSLVAAAAPFDRGAPTPGDGLITAVPTDTLTITYVQPDGSPLTLRVSPPPI